MKNLIEDGDTVAQAMVKMSAGNPGAATALGLMLEDYKSIDPQSSMGGIGLMLRLDELQIYGTEIYVLYSDKCDRDIRKFIVLFRANQFGMITDKDIKEMAADQRREINLSEAEWEVIDEEVCEKLTDFKKP